MKLKLERSTYFCVRFPEVFDSIAVVVFTVAKRHITDSATKIVADTFLSKRTNKVLVVVASCFDYWHSLLYETVIILSFDMVLVKLGDHEFRLIQSARSVHHTEISMTLSTGLWPVNFGLLAWSGWIDSTWGRLSWMSTIQTLPSTSRS